MFEVVQLSNTPYIGADYADFYIHYNQKTKKVIVDGKEVSTKVAFNILMDIKEQLRRPPERGHHYDVSHIADEVRIGIKGHGISISQWDLPLF